MTGKLYINGKDAWTTWGAFLEDGSLERLLSGDVMKENVVNESRSIDGVHVWVVEPKLEARNITIVVCFAQKSGGFLSRYQSFINELMTGRVVGEWRYPNEVYIPEIGKTYKLIYQGNTNLTQMDMSLGKVAIRLFEPNPADR